MNNVLLQQTGGFPLETDTLNFMQNAYSFLQHMAALGGDNYILSGCTVMGSTVSNGVVVIAGEVLEFRGGLIQSTVVVREDKATRPFENGQVKEVYFTRYVTFGTGTGAIAWDSLTRFKPLLAFKDLPTEKSNAIDLDDENKLATAKAVKLLNDKVEARLPSGAIIIWSGSINAIPTGFALCDGQGGRPDLRDKFVLGAGLGYPVGAIGGEAEHQLTTNELARFNVNVNIPTRRNYGSQSSGGTNALAREEKGGADATKSYGSGTIGGDMPHNNMPPYYSLAYIIKL